MTVTEARELVAPEELFVVWDRDSPRLILVKLL
jgi:hypothetical protein